MAVGGNSIPMRLDQFSKLLVGLQPLPFKTVLPAFKEGAGTAFATVVPQLAEGLLEDIGGIQGAGWPEAASSGLCAHPDSGSHVGKARCSVAP